MLAGVPAGATPIVPELRVIRTRGEGEQRATFFELFFDLVYVFAVTQLSHSLIEHFTPFLEREERLLVRVDQYADDYLVKEFAAALDNIQMTVGDRIKGAGVDGAPHVMTC